MGQAISSVIASFENNAEKEKQANDALNAMLEMAKLQVEAFRLSIRSVLRSQASCLNMMTHH